MQSNLGFKAILLRTVIFFLYSIVSKLYSSSLKIIVPLILLTYRLKTISQAFFCFLSPFFYSLTMHLFTTNVRRYLKPNFSLNTCSKYSLQFSEFSLFVSVTPYVMITIVNCFCGIVDLQKGVSLISSQDRCQRFSPWQISNTPWAIFEPK